MDLTSYLLGKERGGGGGGTPTDVQINGTSITSNNRANIITNSAYNASSNKIATMGDVPVIDIVTITTTIDDGETDQLNNADIETITAMAEDWYENIDKTQSSYFENELAKVIYGVDGENLMSGVIKYTYNNDGENADVGIEINFGGLGDVYNCVVNFIVESDELVYDNDGCGYDYFVSRDEFEDVVGNINAILDTLVTVEEGEE